MSIGAPALTTSQKKEKSGAPFPAGSADNGLSVDPITGRIVLGNDDPGILATLLNDREIPLDAFGVTFSSIPNDVFNLIRFDGMRVHNAAFTEQVVISKASINIRDDVGTQGPQLQFNSGGNIIDIFKVLGTKVLEIDDATGPPALGLLQLDFANAISQIGDFRTVQNGNRFRIDDGIGQFSMGINGVGSFLLLDNQVNLYEIGDVSGLVNGTKLAINDATQSFNFDNITSAFAQFNCAGGEMRLNKPGSNSFIQVINAGFSDGLRIDSANNSIRSLAGTGSVLISPAVSTSDPGSGAGLWKLGVRVVAASVVDVTGYIETSINGVIVKIATMV